MTITTHPLTLTGVLTVETNDPSFTGWNDDALLLEESENRITSFSTTSAPTYYIEVVYDINSKVNVRSATGVNDGASADDDNDDSWSLAEISVSNTDGYNSINLPTTAVAGVAVASVDAYNDNSANPKLGSFPLTMDVNHASDGAITATMSNFSGSEIIHSRDDDVTKAQYVYWQINPSAPAAGALGPEGTYRLGGNTQNDGVLGQNDPDELSAIINAANLNSFYATPMAAVVTEFDRNGLDSWTLTINDVAHDTNSNLSRWARSVADTGANNANNDPFNDNDKIVASSPATYGITFTDNDGVTHTLANDVSVYGVVKHASA
jgi:hypothetical protein